MELEGRPLLSSLHACISHGYVGVVIVVSPSPSSVVFLVSLWDRMLGAVGELSFSEGIG